MLCKKIDAKKAKIMLQNKIGAKKQRFWCGKIDVKTKKVWRKTKLVQKNVGVKQNCCKKPNILLKKKISVQ